MTTSPKNSLAIVFVCLLAASAAFGQNVAPELNIALGEQRVRFAPTRGFQEMRLEVVNSVGEIVFTHTTTEAEFDWNLRAANSEALAPGLYRYALTLKFSEDQTRQHTGHFIVEKTQDQIWLTASDGTEVSGTTLNAARTGGRSIAGLGRTEDKSVKRDVSGRELVDEKGNKLPDNKDSTKAVKTEKAALLGTLNKVAKFGVSGNADTDSTIFETGGGFVGIGTTAPTGALHVVSSAVNPLQIEMTGVPGAALTAQMDNFGGGGSSGGSGFLGRAANGSKVAPTNVAAGERLGFNVFGGYAGGGFRHVAAINAFVGTGTISATSLPSFLNFMTTPDGSVSRAERMRIDQNGNVGIGVTAPAAKLEVGGDIRSSALRQELTASSPNVINGFMGTGSGGATPGNRVTPGVVGASIGGGGFNGTLNFPCCGNIAGDNTNRVTDWFGTVGGGYGNRAGDDAGNLDDARFATVGGGSLNTASGFAATVGGGYQNTASNYSATVGGGYQNTASNYSVTVGGGYQNTASGYAATVAGGSLNTASGDSSYAAGQRAKANHQGAFVWGDSTNADFASTGNNQFLIRATGNVGINTNAPETVLTIQTATSNYGLTHTDTDRTIRLVSFIGGSTNSGMFGTRSNHSLAFFTGDQAVQMLLTTTGRLGIGTNAPDQLLSVNGNASKTSGTSWAVFSDERLKHIHGKYTPGLRALLKLQPIRFEYKADNALGLKGSGETVGFSAQAVAAVLPEAVTQSESGYLQLNSDPILWTMLNSIKEQQAQIQQLMQANQQLRQRLNKVERRTKTPRR